MRSNILRDFEAFRAVANRGSFAQAARDLDVSPSAMSQIIRRLEDRTGHQLLHRTTRSVSPTDQGVSLLERLNRAWEEIEEATSELAERRRTPAGTVRLVAPRIAYEDLIEPHLVALHAALPEVVLDIRIDDGFTDIVRGGFDIGVRLGEFIEADTVAVPIGPSLRQLAVATPAYLDVHGIPEHPRDLMKHRCIGWRQSPDAAPYAWEFVRGAERIEVAVEGPLIVSDRGAAARAAAQGLGIALWVEHRLQGLIGAGTLTPLLADWAPAYPGFFLYYYRDRHMSAATRAVVTHFKAGNAAPPMAPFDHDPPGPVA